MHWWLGSKTNFTMPEYSAELEAVFANTGDRTELQHKFHKAPLKIAKTLLREDNQLGVCMMDCSPGMMAGDKYRLEWRLLPESNVFITNQSYTKVHPSAENPAFQFQAFRVERGAWLEYKPEPIMLYKEASFSSDTEIWLEAGAVVFWIDVVCPGRVLRDEIFQYDRYDSRLQVFYENQLIYYNRQIVEPDSQKTDFRHLGSWEGYTHQGTFYIFSDRLKSECLKPIQELLESYPNLLGGVSLTYKHGLVISLLGRSVWELQQLLDEAWLRMKAIIK